MAQQNSVGYVSVNPSGDYARGKTYQPYSLVRYQCKLYLSRKETAELPTNTAEWLLLNIDTQSEPSNESTQPISNAASAGTSTQYARADHTHTGLILRWQTYGYEPNITAGKALTTKLIDGYNLDVDILDTTAPDLPLKSIRISPVLA